MGLIFANVLLIWPACRSAPAFANWHRRYHWKKQVHFETAFSVATTNSIIGGASSVVLSR
jgi:hypothetical protein